jgi:hypothetical protein
LPFYLAEERGFFEKEGIRVRCLHSHDGSEESSVVGQAKLLHLDQRDRGSGDRSQSQGVVRDKQFEISVRGEGIRLLQI